MLYCSAQATYTFLPRWQQLRAIEVMLYRSAQTTDMLLPRWHQQRAPEVMLYRSAQATYTFLPRAVLPRPFDAITHFQQSEEAITPP